MVNSGSTTSGEEQTNYYIWSSVLNKVVSETDAAWGKVKTFVPAIGATLAVQETGTSEYVSFPHADASGTAMQETVKNGTLIGDTTYNRRGEYAPLGRNLANAAPYNKPTTRGA